MSQVHAKKEKIGTTFQGIRNADGNCRLGTYTDSSGAQHEKYADIAFLDMPQSAFNAQRVYGDVTHRTVVGTRGGDLVPVRLAHLRAGLALQVADAQKTQTYDQALRGRQNEKVAILGIEAGGRMHKHFHRLIDTFAKFKADADAGPLDNNTSPASIKFHQSVFSRTNSLLNVQDPGRAREVRGGANHARHSPVFSPASFSRFPPRACEA